MTSDARAKEEKEDEAGDVDDDEDENDGEKGKTHVVRRQRRRADNAGFLHGLIKAHQIMNVSRSNNSSSWVLSKREAT